MFLVLHRIVPACAMLLVASGCASQSAGEKWVVFRCPQGEVIVATFGMRRLP